ncbi:MAG: hypothetical protein KJ850_05090 [Gammaproteobacteria bacterium]|nr:hypothetical protein [Gammaproteobacteria bacterium]MBU1624407.1 hypothetical protein [Gammaproteobacteria bacterium]MBU1981135.1 hypothetical protein [Gammaproteobacteria bacterium]
MKILFNKNEVVATAQYIVDNNPRSNAPSLIPHTDRGYQPVRGEVDEILNNIRTLARKNKDAFNAVQQQRAAGDTDCNPLLQEWIEVLGVGGYWIIAEVEDDAINFALAVSPWFGEDLIIEEDI